MRIANRLLALLAAMALIATGIILIIEVIAARSGASPVVIGWHSILSWGQRNTWKADSVELACVITALFGLLLLLPQLRRRRPTRLTITSSGQTDAALTRKGVAATVRGAVNDVEGISGSKFAVSHRRIQVDATSSATTDDVAQRSKSGVKDAAQKAIDELRLTANRRLRVNVTGRQKGR